MRLFESWSDRDGFSSIVTSIATCYFYIEDRCEPVIYDESIGVLDYNLLNIPCSAIHFILSKAALDSFRSRMAVVNPDILL